MATDYKTLRVPEAAYAQAKADKRDEETWGEFLQRCSKNPPEIRRFVEAGDVSTDKIINRIDDLETELTTQHERLGR